MNIFTKRFTIIIGVMFLMCDTPIPNNQSSEVREIYFKSKSINSQTYFLIYVPQTVKIPVPVLFLLNGYGANPYAWSSGADIQRAADDYKMLIVSISAGANSYVDISGSSDQNYESYVLEIVRIVDDNFDTGNSKEYRGICGISNGAMGAIYIASKNPDLFVSASALSGGYYTSYPPNYNNLRDVNLLIDVGTGDDVVLENVRALHDKLVDEEISHIYNEYPGGHDWLFWGRHYNEHFIFHSDVFKD